MIRLLLYALLRPFVGWTALLVILVVAEAVLRTFVWQVLLPALDPFLPRAATAALALAVLGAGTFFLCCLLAWQRRRARASSRRIGF